MTAIMQTLLIMTTYCASRPTSETVDQCRVIRMSCVERANVQRLNVKLQDAVSICMSDPSSFKIPVKMPIATDVPTIKTYSGVRKK
jgi:hypothetical protein